MKCFNYVQIGARPPPLSWPGERGCIMRSTLFRRPPGSLGPALGPLWRKSGQRHFPQWSTPCFSCPWPSSKQRRACACEQATTGATRADPVLEASVTVAPRSTQFPQTRLQLACSMHAEIYEPWHVETAGLGTVTSGRARFTGGCRVKILSQNLRVLAPAMLTALALGRQGGQQSWRKHSKAS